MTQTLITGLRQVCIVTQNFEQTVQDLAATFGIGPWKCWDFKHPKILDTRKNGQPALWTKKLGVAWVGEVQLEVIQATGGATIYEEYIARHGEGVQHLLVKTGPGYFDAIRRFEAAGYSTFQSARINPPMQIGPVSLPPLPGFLAGRFAVQYVYHDTETALGATLETSKMPPGVPFRLGVSLGKPDVSVQPGRPAIFTGIRTIGIITEDLEAARQRWLEAGVGPWNDVPAAGARIASAACGSAAIELVQPDADGVYRQLLDTHGTGVRYLGITGASPDTLRNAGCAFLGEDERGVYLDASSAAHTVFRI